MKNMEATNKYYVYDQVTVKYLDMLWTNYMFSYILVSCPRNKKKILTTSDIMKFRSTDLEPARGSSCPSPPPSAHGNPHV